MASSSPRLPTVVRTTPVRDRQFRLNLTAGELTSWRKAARVAGMNVSEWVRRELAVTIAAAEVAAARTVGR